MSVPVLDLYNITLQSPHETIELGPEVGQFYGIWSCTTCFLAKPDAGASYSDAASELDDMRNVA
jgi:hypothetical protein